MKFFGKSDDDEQESTIRDLRDVVSAAHMPPAVAKIAEQELQVLSKISPSATEFSIGLTYIDYLATLPWNKKTPDNLDLSRAERILNEHHYGLARVKERILEHLAVKVLRGHRKPVVLIVDDEEIARKNLSHLLLQENCEVLSASNGAEALDRMEARECDVVLTDLRMGDLDGMELLEKTSLRRPDIKIIVITGYASISSAIESVKKGAFDYIAKPFKLDQVREAVRKAIAAKSDGKSTKGSVLCFSGPPGTGKTSVGRAVAQALGRKFTRIALGGMKDEAGIRGHRRTYTGARPGRIIEEIHRLETANPVIMLDELDKMGQDVKGDPASALLEVLDPEQNNAFVDHYLDAPFDLSSVMFIITANLLDAIHAPLRDRMEVIQFPGYTQEEKAVIATRFLVPKQIREKGLSTDAVRFGDPAIVKIIQEYTREAGIRGLERQIATICRKLARETLLNPAPRVEIGPDSLEHYLGTRKYQFEVIEEKDRIGVATGLVWTQAGGEIIFVEAAKMKGDKELIITGSLGDVMRESAQAAVSYIRSSAADFGIDENFFERQDLHIHVPGGAIPKDGPSAGLTIAMALLSLLTRQPARKDVAMTGEITLTGRILPVGGIREKVLAARRAKVKTVIIPARNRADAEDLDQDIRESISIRLVDSVTEAAETVLIRA